MYPLYGMCFYITLTILFDIWCENPFFLGYLSFYLFQWVQYVKDQV
jgi:hypothetical protein